MTLSASGARIQGDDYQHLFAWYHALRLLNPNEGVTAIEIEADGAGNVDDVVVRRAKGADEYYQVKYSVDGQNPITNAWWLERPNGKGTSILQKFWASWKEIKDKGEPPRMGLFTNRAVDVGDPILKLRDGRNGRLMPRLGAETASLETRKRRTEWAKHLGVSEAEMLSMFEHLDLLTEQGPWSMLLTSTADRMAALGLKSDKFAVEQGWVAAHTWVTQGLRKVEAKDLRAEIEQRHLQGGPRRATLAVQAIDWLRWAGAATARVDWVNLFEGDHPRERRQLRDPAMWNDRLWPELQTAERQIQGLGFNRVAVRGHMRLPVWFAVGVAFADTRGVQVECLQGGQVWASDVPAAAYELKVTTEELGQGGELAMGLSVTNDLAEEVLTYIKEVGLAVGRFVHVASPQLGKDAIPGAVEAMGWATAVRSIVREQARKTKARKLHLFMSGPAGGALLLGSLWNRVPTTQVYEDLNPGYTPTFFIPG